MLFDVVHTGYLFLSYVNFTDYHVETLTKCIHKSSNKKRSKKTIL